MHGPSFKLFHMPKIKITSGNFLIIPGHHNILSTIEYADASPVASLGPYQEASLYSICILCIKTLYMYVIRQQFIKWTPPSGMALWFKHLAFNNDKLYPPYDRWKIFIEHLVSSRSVCFHLWLMGLWASGPARPHKVCNCFCRRHSRYVPVVHC